MINLIKRILENPIVRLLVLMVLSGLVIWAVVTKIDFAHITLGEKIGLLIAIIIIFPLLWSFYFILKKKKYNNRVLSDKYFEILAQILLIVYIWIGVSPIVAYILIALMIAGVFYDRKKKKLTSKE